MSSLAAAALAASLLSTSALEDPAIPAGTVKKDAASSGSTDLGGSGQFASAAAKEENDITSLNLSAGGILNTGNARSLAVTGLGKFQIRRKAHQFTAAAAGNYGRAALALNDDEATMDVDESRIVDTVSNVQGQVRYDYFFHPRFAAFLMSTARYDKFQGLDLRLNVDPGVAMYALMEEKHKMWFEVGYDFQFDLRSERGRDLAEVASGGERPSKTLVNHAARLFAGYTNNLSKHVTFDTGFEYLQSFLSGPRFRLNWVNALGVTLTDRFSLGATFTMRYENRPLDGVAPLDTITSLLLNVKLI
jgi:putative salt-induced outer membrane protein